mgnify:CR=1 FL=1
MQAPFSKLWAAFLRLKLEGGILKFGAAFLRLLANASEASVCAAFLKMELRFQAAFPKLWAPSCEAPDSAPGTPGKAPGAPDEVADHANVISKTPNT